MAMKRHAQNSSQTISRGYKKFYLNQPEKCRSAVNLMEDISWIPIKTFSRSTENNKNAFCAWV